MPRPLDPEARRRQVAEAVWRVVAGHGLSAASIRTVAAEAGLSAGAMRHVLPTQAAIHLAAMEELERRFKARLDAIAPHDDPRERLIEEALATMPLDDASRAENRVYFAFLAQAAADPGLREAADAIRAEGAAWCAATVARLGVDDPAQAEAELHALVDGLALHATMWPAETTAATIRAALQRWLDGPADLARSSSTAPSAADRDLARSDGA